MHTQEQMTVAKTGMPGPTNCAADMRQTGRPFSAAQYPAYASLPTDVYSSMEACIPVSVARLLILEGVSAKRVSALVGKSTFFCHLKHLLTGKRTQELIKLLCIPCAVFQHPVEKPDATSRSVA